MLRKSPIFLCVFPILHIIIIFSFGALSAQIKRDPDTRKDYANVFYKPQYTLFDLWSDEPIYPDNNGIYKIYVSTNEDKTPKELVGNGEEIANHAVYKFKSLSNCQSWCKGIEFSAVNAGNTRNISGPVTNQSSIKTITIGAQVWMTNNLDVSTFRNGDPIPQATSLQEVEDAGKNQQPIWCYYNFDSSLGINGKLYNWYAVNDTRGIAPNGFHIPSDSEWSILVDFAGGKDAAGEKLKSQAIYETYYAEVGGYYKDKWVSCSNCSYWTDTQKKNNPCAACKNKGGKYVQGDYIPKTKEKRKRQIGGMNGSNEFGFCAEGAGMLDDTDFSLNAYILSFRSVNEIVRFWTSSESVGRDKSWATYYTLLKNEDDVASRNSPKAYCFSVRCLKN